MVMAYNPLRIVEQKVNDTTVGYLVGVWCYPRNVWHGNPRKYFRRVADGVSFGTFKEAQRYRERIYKNQRAIDIELVDVTDGE
jgi:hypothetical protein